MITFTESKITVVQRTVKFLFGPKSLLCMRRKASESTFDLLITISKSSVFEILFLRFEITSTIDLPIVNQFLYAVLLFMLLITSDFLSLLYMLQHSPLLCSCEELTLKEDLSHPLEPKDYANGIMSYKLKFYYIIVHFTSGEPIMIGS